MAWAFLPLTSLATAGNWVASGGWWVFGWVYPSLVSLPLSRKRHWSNWLIRGMVPSPCLPSVLRVCCTSSWSHTAHMLISLFSHIFWNLNYLCLHYYPIPGWSFRIQVISPQAFLYEWPSPILKLKYLIVFWYIPIMLKSSYSSCVHSETLLSFWWHLAKFLCNCIQ